MRRGLAGSARVIDPLAIPQLASAANHIMLPPCSALWALLAPGLFAHTVFGVPAAYGPLDVRDFGAVGDGVTDDAPAIQRAINQAQQVSALGKPSGPSRPVYFPAGFYVVKRTLEINSTHLNESNHQLALSLRLYGDGMAQSIIVAGAAMDAVVRFGGYGPTGGIPGVTTNGHTIESMAFNAAGLANYSVAATAITRSLFRFADFSGARIAGLFLGYGWINDVLECYFTGNLVGLYLDNAVNSVNVVDGNFEDNYGVGIIVNSGAMVRLEGNEFESMGGPGIIANAISALTIRSNYFEANNVGWPAGNASKVISYEDHHSGASEDVCTDILLNGNGEWGPERSDGKYPFVIPGPEGRLVLAPIYLSNVAPNAGVVIQANSHSPGTGEAGLAACPGSVFSGVFAAGATGLQASSSDCGGCGAKHYHFVEVVLGECDAVRNPCGGKNSLWTAIKSDAPSGGYIFKSALAGTQASNKCYMLNIPGDLSLGGFQVVAFGDTTCDTSSDQTSFTVTGGLLETKGFQTAKCSTSNGCCVQWTNTSNATSSPLEMALCDSANSFQQFEVEHLDGQPGRIRDKSSGRCLSVKNCELETGGGSNDDLTCVAVTTGRAPDANSSLADMLVTLNTGAFANA
eukprot:COSAG03_NODE_643_length_6532_cov_3.761387_2_plen_630_part_00